LRADVARVGDFAEWTEHGGMVIHGRSDATLNAGGVRIGTAEIYRQVELLEEVQQSVVIDQDWNNDVRVVLFVILKPGFALDDSLRDRIKKQIRAGASPHHVPGRIIQVADIPARFPSSTCGTSCMAATSRTGRRSPTPRQSTSVATWPSSRVRSPSVPAPAECPIARQPRCDRPFPRH